MHQIFYPHLTEKVPQYTSNKQACLAKVEADYIHK